MDLPPVNNYTAPHQYPLPVIEHDLKKLATSSHFATFDLSYGYWQLSLDKESQEFQFFVTPDGIFTPTRVLHGTTNSVAQMQLAIQHTLPPAIRPHLPQWLDGLLLYASNITDLLNCIRLLFISSRDFNISLHPEKCLLFTTSVRGVAV